MKEPGVEVNKNIVYGLAGIGFWNGSSDRKQGKDRHRRRG